MESTTVRTTGRVMPFLRAVVDFGVLGFFFVLASLPVVTVAFATAALHAALVTRDETGAENMPRAFIDGLRSTAGDASRMTFVVVPILLAQVVAVSGLVAWGGSISTVLLGVTVAASVLWWSYLLFFHSTFALAEELSVRVAARSALRGWILSPWRPLLAVILGITLVAVAWTGFIAAAFFAVSLPAWLVYSRHPWRSKVSDGGTK